MATQQVTFADFVVQTRQWQKWAEKEIADIKNRISQLESAHGLIEKSLNEVVDDVTHKLADMSAMLESTNGMISELLDNMPGENEDEDEANYHGENEDETRNATMDKIELDEQDDIPELKFEEQEQTE